MSVTLEGELQNPAGDLMLAENLEQDAHAAAPVHDGLIADTLADSILLMALIAIVQRGVGFVRSLLVCRWLSPAELGQWDVALGFLVMAAPLAVVGLPGSFGRYLEHYRRQGHLTTILRRTGVVCIVLTLLVVGAIFVFPSFVSQLIFGSPQHIEMVVVLAISLAVVVAYNYLGEVLNALRLFRYLSLVQFFNSMAFAALSIGLVWLWQPTATAVVAAYAGSCLVVLLVMAFWIRRAWKGFRPAEEHLSHSSLWGKLVPFAAWVWVTNILFNSFELADRYLIVHFAAVSDPLALVGQYHSSRVIPLLMVSLATLLGGMILPHLTHDWEAGRRSAVSVTLNLTLKLLSLVMLAGGIAVLALAPLLFATAFGNKYASGLAVLPGTLTYCIWLAVAAVAQMYLWCAEKARIGTLALLIGLVANVVLNLLLLPRYGLPGAVTATAISNGFTLLVILYFNRRQGMHVEAATLVLLLSPVSLVFGPVTAIVTLAILLLAAWRTPWLMTAEQRATIHDVAQKYRSKLSALVGRRTSGTNT